MFFLVKEKKYSPTQPCRIETNKKRRKVIGKEEQITERNEGKKSEEQTERKQISKTKNEQSKSK